MGGKRDGVICLFDVDGTLTKPRNKVTPEVLAFVECLRGVCTLGVVGGSDLTKIKEQLGDDAPGRFDYMFSENGLRAEKGGALIAEQSIVKHLGEANLQRFINFVLHYLADLVIPVKRGTFIEFRNGMINVSPVGRNCSQAERDAFEKFDAGAGVRTKMVEVLQREFADLNLTYSIGGQISFDVFPAGWDKTFCLQFVEADGFKEIHFFGDKTYKGGNDYEIFESPKTIGHAVTSPEDMMEQVRALFPEMRP